MDSTRRTQIIQTAAQLFRKRGYGDVTMRDLAEELHIRASSIYNHIASKDQILSEIVMGLAQDFTTHIHQTRATEATAIDRLSAIIDMHVDTTYSNADFLACMNREWKYLGEKDKEKYIELRAAYEEDFFAILKTGIDSGEICERNYKVMGNSILSVLRTFYHWYDKIDLTKNEVKKSLYKNLIFAITTSSSLVK